MKRIIILLFSTAFIVFLGTSCKTYELGHEEWRVVPTVSKNYKILGTIRLEAKRGTKEATYDGLLQKTRQEFGQRADVIGIKMDEFKKGDFYWVILNCYAIEYID